MQLELKPFTIEFNYNSKRYTAKAVQEIKDTIEVFTITSNNRSIQIQSDRPFINSLPNSRKKPKFKALNAKVDHLAFCEAVISALEAHIKDLERKPFDRS